METVGGATICNEATLSNDYLDLLYEYSISIDYLQQLYNPVCIQFMDSRFAVFHLKRTEANEKLFRTYGYNAIPKLYGLLDTTSVDSTGSSKARRQPYLNLTGRDVLLAFIDTGIDYTNPIFINADNTSRIVSIWDQTIESDQVLEGYFYGTEYTQEQINQALSSSDPYSVVPSRDTNGHGTFLAGIAAGGADRENDFTGVAPAADIVVVKLKDAKPFLKEFFGVADSIECYQETDIMLAVKYIFEAAQKANKPVVICLGVGTSSGDHNGNSILSSYLDEYANLDGICMVVAGGNEGNQAHHYQGNLTGAEDSVVMEIRVGEGERGFSMEMWGRVPNRFSISIRSPSGELIPRIPARLQQSNVYNLLLENTTITVDYNILDERSGDELVFLRFETPTVGIWNIQVYSDSTGAQTFDAWLPMQTFITAETYFILPNPNVTITEPGNAARLITVAAYNHNNNSIYISSSRGNTRDGRQEPDLTAPGVDVYGPSNSRTYTTRTGTSVAAAHLAGSAALLFDWGITQKNNYTMSTVVVKQLLIRGADRKPELTYPNEIWGYGTIDLYESFNSLRIT